MEKSGSSSGEGSQPTDDNSSGPAPIVQQPIMVGIFFAVIAVFLTMMYFYIRNKKRGRAILIVGPSEAGKTAVFVRVGFGKDVDTVTSTAPNVAEYEVRSKAAAPLILKDLPGNEKVRMKFWEENKVGVRGIICVVDAAGGSKSIRDAAEVLYDILTDSIVNSVKPDILIFANKQDMPTTKAAKIVRLQLEREITTLRLTKSASLKTTGGNSSAPIKVLGKLDRDFEFDQLLPLKVEFAEGTANGEDSELKPVLEWLDRIA